MPNRGAVRLQEQFFLFPSNRPVYWVCRRTKKMTSIIATPSSGSAERLCQLNMQLKLSPAGAWFELGKIIFLTIFYHWSTCTNRYYLHFKKDLLVKYNDCEAIFVFRFSTFKTFSTKLANAEFLCMSFSLVYLQFLQDPKCFPQTEQLPSVLYM